jgi:uncharacterized coiled-coil DUF342 family protein
MTDTKQVLQNHFKALCAKRDAIRAEVEPLRAEREKLHAKIGELQGEVEKISEVINAKVNSEGFIELKNEISAVARALGSKVLSGG